MKHYWIACSLTLLLAGCSSKTQVEVPKDAKPGPTVIPTVRDAGEGFKVK